MENLTISKLLTGKLPRLRVNQEEVEQWDNSYNYKPIFPIVDKNSYIGLELEIERSRVLRSIEPIWRADHDDSLRHGGIEYISLPIKASLAEKALIYLFEQIALHPESYSGRTSIHVHMNVRTLTQSQLTNLILVYLIFEKALFHWVGHGRENNIFCVPLYSTQLNETVIKTLEDIRNLHWYKYTALNLLPVLEKGSIEFRHLHGTNDIRSIITWINLLLSLKVYALSTKQENILDRILTLNTTSDYRTFALEVFKNALGRELFYPEFDKDMSFCITNIKRACLFNEFHLKHIENVQAKPQKKTPSRNPFDFDDIQPTLQVTGGFTRPQDWLVQEFRAQGDVLIQEDRAQREREMTRIIRTPTIQVDQDLLDAFTATTATARTRRVDDITNP